MVLGGLAGSDGLSRVLPVVAGFLALVAFGRRALVLWNVDALLFDDPSRGPRLPARPRQAARPRRSFSGRRNALRLVGLAGISLLFSVAMPGQQIAEGRWVLYASYTFKKVDSRRKGLLLEMGFTP
jgi:hypothetical protein